MNPAHPDCEAEGGRKSSLRNERFRWPKEVLTELSARNIGVLAKHGVSNCVTRAKANRTGRNDVMGRFADTASSPSCREMLVPHHSRQNSPKVLTSSTEASAVCAGRQHLVLTGKSRSAETIKISSSGELLSHSRSIFATVYESTDSVLSLVLRTFK